MAAHTRIHELITHAPLPLAAALLAAAPASATQPPATTPPDSATPPAVGCLQGAPLPTCASFWLIEMQASTTLVEPSWTESNPFGGTAQATADRDLVEWTVGHMWNASSAWSVGATISAGNNARGNVTGLRLRVRRWLSPALSASFETGLARSTAQPRAFDTGIGPSVGLRLDSRDYVSAFVRYDRVEVVRPDRDDPRFSTPSPHQYLRVGVGLGGKAALVGSGVVALGALAVAILVGQASGT